MTEKATEPKIEWNAKSIVLLVVLSITVLGVVFFIGTVDDKSNVDAWLKRTATWSGAPGQITELSSYSATDGSLRGTNKGPFYPKVKYEYVVDGVNIKGETLGKPNLPFVTEEDATTYLQRFKVGNKVTVYYDPKMVTQSCLVKGVKLTAETPVPQSD